MSDLIDRHAAIDAIMAEVDDVARPNVEHRWWNLGLTRASEILKQLPSAQPEQSWIPVSERLPGEDKKVLCSCRANIIEILERCDDVWFEDIGTGYLKGYPMGFVLAWMPLPEPWKGEEE